MLIGGSYQRPLPARNLPGNQITPRRSITGIGSLNVNASACALLTMLAVSVAVWPRGALLRFCG